MVLEPAADACYYDALRTTTGEPGTLSTFVQSHVPPCNGSTYLVRGTVQRQYRRIITHPSPVPGDRALVDVERQCVCVAERPRDRQREVCVCGVCASVLSFLAWGLLLLAEIPSFSFSSSSSPFLLFLYLKDSPTSFSSEYPPSTRLQLGF